MSTLTSLLSLAQLVAPTSDTSAAHWLDLIVLGNPVRAWVTSGVMFLALVFIAYFLRWIIVARVSRIAERTTTRWDDSLVQVVKRIRIWLIAPLLLLIATRALVIPDNIDKFIRIIAVACVAIQLFLSLLVLIDGAILLIVSRFRNEKGEPDPTINSSVGVLRVMLVGLLGVLVVLLALDNLNVSITPMLTGLGIGGIAVALAVQNILGDLFGSLTIILDKPFVVGDAISVGNQSGVVERIGIKTTRVRATSGEQLVFANSDLLTSRIQNFKRMDERRVAFAFGVAYETPTEKLKRIPEIVRAIATEQPSIRFDRCHFKTLGAYSLDFEVVYFVTSPDYLLFMNTQQTINLTLLERFAAEGIEFAYPTQVAIQREGEARRPA